METRQLVLVLIIIGLFIIGPMLTPVSGIVWDPAAQVPMDIGKLTVNPSAAEDPNGRVWLAWSETTLGGGPKSEIFFKYQNPFSGIWTQKSNVSASPAADVHPLMMSLPNGSMMILWSSDRTGNPDLFYRRYLGFSPVIPATQLTSHPLEDISPSAAQDRNGRIWVVWERKNSTVAPGCGCVAPSDIYYKYHNGASWSQDFPLPAASTSTFSERSPTIMQSKDGKIWIMWASDDGPQRSLELYFATTDGTVETLPPTGIPPAYWAPRRWMFTDTKDDDNPDILQTRDGVISAFWQQDTGSDGDIRTVNSLDNGASWEHDVPTGYASTTSTESSVSAVQMSDNKIWVFWNKQGATTREIWYTASDQITGIHDVGISGLAATPSFLRAGGNVSIEVNATNHGDFPETTQLTVKLNNTVILSLSLSLADGETETHLITWPSTWGRYVMNASLTTVTGENAINQADNSWTGWTIRATPPGDVDFDGDVDIIDAALLAFAFGSTPSSTNWNPNADIDKNGTVDIVDAARLAVYYGKAV